jgi:hypothetical protein
MSRRVRQLLLPLLATATLLCVLLMWDPFRVTRDLAARLSGPVREDAMVTNLYRDARTQEITNGEAPLQGLNQLAAQWCENRDPERYVLMGNSQTFTILLAPSERNTGSAERTYPDQIIERESTAGRSVRGYRLSAPNLSYAEVLWYVHFLLTRECMAPGRIIVQLNYESFRKVGIRSGMLDLLSDAEFARRVAQEANSPAAYSGTFRQAVGNYAEAKARARGPGAGGAAATSKTGMTQSRGIGAQAESWVRGALESASAFHARTNLKLEFMTTLYLLRVNVLGITPTTKRSLGELARTMSLSALQRVGELCEQNHIKLEFFLAPQNPRAVLYRTEQDRRDYLAMTEQLSRRYAWRAANFEDGIPEQMWGIWVDGPDPIHFGRAAHERMASLMIGAGLVPDGG